MVVEEAGSVGGGGGQIDGVLGRGARRISLTHGGESEAAAPRVSAGDPVKCQPSFPTLSLSLSRAF